MEADHVEVLLGDRAPVNIVHVLVMSIRHGHVREAAARLVHNTGIGKESVMFNPLNGRASPNSSRQAQTPGNWISARKGLLRPKTARPDLSHSTPPWCD